MRRFARVVAVLLLLAVGGCGTAPAPTPSPEAFEGGFVAHGDDEALQGAAWVSADGRAWRRVELPTAETGGYVTAIAVGHGRVVVLGGIKGADGISRLAAWVGPASLLAP